jgi:peptidyl-prolyl cis-trans isomerase A (cyclophilin A)
MAMAALLAGGCARQPDAAKEAEKEAADARQPAAEQPAPPAEQPQPTPEPKKEVAEPKKAVEDKNIYRVRLDTSKGPITVEVHRDWAPIGADRFQQLVKDGFYDGARFFRVVPNFVVQFGLAADPAKTKKWDKPIKDDPVKRTNSRGSIVFATAGPGTRTTQLFINLRSNQFLDEQGFSPFGQVVEGMDVVDQIYAGYGEQPDQQAITNRGNAYLNAQFPKLDFIKSARIL